MEIASRAAITAYLGKIRERGNPCWEMHVDDDDDDGRIHRESRWCVEEERKKKARKARCMITG